MNLDPFVTTLREQLATAAEAGGEEARALVARLTAPMDAAVRLMLLEALSSATAEITRELAPGSVDVRLRGGEPEFVVTPPPAQPAGAADEAPDAGEQAAAAAGEGNVARINLRLPDELKSRVERAADREGLSINAWLVRTVAAAVERGEGGGRAEKGGSRSAGGRRYTGWGR
jgi:HicB family